MKRLVFATALVAATALSANAVNLTMIQNLNLGTTLTNATANPTQYIGTNLSSLTWDGSTAYIGGANNGTPTINVGIARVSGVLSATQTYSNAFGTVSASTTRRITSLVTNAAGTQVFASFDSGAAGGDALRAFNTATLAQQWRVGDATAANTTLRGYGATIDPGFNGTGASAGSVALLSFNVSGRRAALNSGSGTFVTSGANTYNFPGGMVVTGSGTALRDLQFDTDGDAFVRENNRLVYANRTGDNSVDTAAGSPKYIDGFTQPSQIVAGIDYQNLALATNSPAGKFVFWNNRTSTAPGQTLASVLNAFKVNDSVGSVTAEAITVSLNGFAAPGTGIGAYDFSYAAVNNTLAVTDFSNNRLYVFQVTATPVVVPEVGTLPLLALGGLTVTGLVARKRRNG